METAQRVSPSAENAVPLGDSRPSSQVVTVPSAVSSKSLSTLGSLTISVSQGVTVTKLAPSSPGPIRVTSPVSGSMEKTPSRPSASPESDVAAITRPSQYAKPMMPGTSAITSQAPSG